tara:strand:+ start:401 stop:910 length:510 start_codon:yes stop_codon:yes gene_type:complete
MGYQLIETITVGVGGVASIEFTGIPGTGQDLVCLVSGRIANTNSFNFTINSNTGSVYSSIALLGNGSAGYRIPSSSAANVFGGYVPTNNSYTANIFSSNSIYFSNYASSSNKSFSSDGVNENNDSGSLATIVAGGIADTNPITSIQLLPAASQTWVQHTTASIYTITAD